MIPFPDKKYSIIYADPPWSYSDSGCSGAAAAQYATMSINELKQLPVNPAGGGIAADDCVLFMWATYPKMQEALDLIEAWGFKIQVDRLPVDQAEPQRKRLLFRPRPLDSRQYRALPDRHQRQAEAHQRRRRSARVLAAAQA